MRTDKARANSVDTANIETCRLDATENQYQLQQTDNTVQQNVTRNVCELPKSASKSSTKLVTGLLNVHINLIRIWPNVNVNVPIDETKYHKLTPQVRIKDQSIKAAVTRINIDQSVNNVEILWAQQIKQVGIQLYATAIIGKAW